MNIINWPFERNYTTLNTKTNVDWNDKFHLQNLIYSHEASCATFINM